MVTNKQLIRGTQPRLELSLLLEVIVIGNEVQRIQLLIDGELIEQYRVRKGFETPVSIGKAVEKCVKMSPVFTVFTKTQPLGFDVFTDGKGGLHSFTSIVFPTLFPSTCCSLPKPTEGIVEALTSTLSYRGETLLVE